MRKALLSMMMAIVMMAGSGSLWAYGTLSGTDISNAKTVGSSPDLRLATNQGQLSANFANVSGVTNFASVQGSIAVTRVTQGFDLSPVLVLTPTNQSGSAGSLVTFTFFLTNWGNSTVGIGSYMTNIVSTGGWPTNTYVLKLNSVTGVQGTNLKKPNVGNDFAPGSIIRFDALVYIPVALVDGSSNVFLLNMGHAGTLDSWPTASAILPAIPDVANVRDRQGRRCVVRVSGPILRISKTVDNLIIRPFETLTYTITYTNVGSATAFNVRIQDVIPTYATNIQTPEISLNGGAFAAAAGDAVVLPRKIQFTPNAGTIASGNYGQLRFTVQVK